MAARNAVRDKRNFSTAIKEARIGHRESQYEVGLMYANGIGIDQDFSQAIYWIRQSAERGFAAAQYLLATRYAVGEAVEQDEHLALKWFVKASDQGHPKAIYKLARFFATVHAEASYAMCLNAARLGVAQAQFDCAVDLSRGFSGDDGLHQRYLWCLQAAEQGLAPAQCAVADMYVRGTGVEIDVREAYVWYRKAARKYFAPAQVAMVSLDERGQGRQPVDSFRSSLPGAAERRRDDQRWVQAAEAGDAHFKYCLGLMYKNGWGIEQNKAKARMWFDASANLGNKAAQLVMTEFLEAESNYMGALVWHRKMADQKQPESCEALGRYYLEGRGTVVDDFKGLLWTLKAVELGSETALGTLSSLLLGNDPRIVSACLRKAAEAGAVNAQYALGQWHESGGFFDRNIKNAISWYTRAADQGHAQAQCALGLIYSEGKDVAKDFSLARKYFLEAAEQGDAKAQWNLAVMLISGSVGVKKDLKQAFVLCQNAANQGFVPAQATLGILYSKMKKPEKAAKWWLLAAERGDPEAQFNLAVAYVKGNGVERDMNVAVTWFERAAGQGVVSAQSKLGLLYATGDGVALDRIEAYKWLVVASRQGEVAAIANARYLEPQLGVMEITEANRRANLWIEIAQKRNLCE